nr:RnfABCDGE type electron transport complex subunit B [uncultured Schaedlerella sp.]
MSMTGILLAAVIVGGTGLLIGVFLGISGKAFAVEVDEREEAILGVLPGNNCGGCGYAGCSGLAAAIVKGEAEVGACPVGGTPVAAKIGDIMGQAAGDQVRQTAFVKCGGTCEKAQDEYTYYGIQDCTMASMMQDTGPKGCDYGCLGFGSCVKACPFDAIHVVDGIAVVDKEKCKACGKCIAACPKKLIELVPYDQKTFVQCNSNEKGKALMDVCLVGCIGCKLCERNCEAGAIKVTNFLAHIDAQKCTNCGVCADKCPRKIITPRKIPVS